MKANTIFLFNYYIVPCEYGTNHDNCFPDKKCIKGDTDGTKRNECHTGKSQVGKDNSHNV